jgi:hypothetical protein
MLFHTFPPDARGMPRSDVEFGVGVGAYEGVVRVPRRVRRRLILPMLRSDAELVQFGDLAGFAPVLAATSSSIWHCHKMRAIWL